MPSGTSNGLGAGSVMEALDRIAVHAGDLTILSVDAIVNAANESLLGGGGVDGAIHRAAGSELLAACKQLGGCPTGEAKWTPGFQLPARFVIHTVGPVWRGGRDGEDRLLAACYRNSLRVATECGALSIAFPAISTGVFGFPKERAATLALTSTLDFLGANVGAQLHVTMCCFSSGDEDLYRKLLEELV